MAREMWVSKLGVILAVAGSAVGLGNFLRFPGLLAKWGGTFMIPYFISLVLIGLPLMWVEWTIGRFGGGFGHSTAPGVFHSMGRKNRFIKYFGVIGILGPLLIFVYYTYIESWLLGYSFLALFDNYDAYARDGKMGNFLASYMGMDDSGPFKGVSVAYTLFLLTFIVNISVVWRGLSEGIEHLCKLAMPLLFLLALVLMVRVFTLPAHEGRTVSDGLAMMWEPKWEQLSQADMWFDAASQVFFTLSVGIGVIMTYASYITKKDDIALSGLTAASTNEFTEVILGGSVVIPAAFVFFGAQATQNYAQSGTFSLGFIAMPMALEQMPLGNVLGFVWFFLLFIAGVTSSISLAQPAIAFLEDEFNLSKSKATAIFAMVTFGLCQLVVFWNRFGSIDEFDFWAGKFCLITFGFIELVMFVWIFGMDKAWDELHVGSDIRIPKIYHFITKWITPPILALILGYWMYSEGLAVMGMEKIPPEKQPYILTIRLMLLGLFLLLCVLVALAWRKRSKEAVQ